METHFANMEHAQSAIARSRVVDDLKSLVQDSEQLLHATAGDLSDKAKDARARLSEALARAKVTCNDLQEQTTATARAAAGKADDLIRSHPYESASIGFGLGLLIGVFANRR